MIGVSIVESSGLGIASVIVAAWSPRTQGTRWCPWFRHSVPLLAWPCGSAYVVLSAFAQALQLLWGWRCECQSCAEPAESRWVAFAHSAVAIEGLLEVLVVGCFEWVVA